MVGRDYFVCFRNFSKRLNILLVFRKKEVEVLVVIRRYFRKYDTMEVSGGSYTEQKSLLAGHKNGHFHN